jgi:transposase InsO family protein
MSHTRGKPYHPMTQGKIEACHGSLKNRILLEHYYLPGQIEARLTEFVDFYNAPDRPLDGLPLVGAELVGSLPRGSHA